MNNTFNNLLKHLTLPNGFNIKKERINDNLILRNNIKLNNDKEINEQIFIKLYAHIDPEYTSKNEKKLSRNNKPTKHKKNTKKIQKK